MCLFSSLKFLNPRCRGLSLLLAARDHIQWCSQALYICLYCKINKTLIPTPLHRIRTPNAFCCTSIQIILFPSTATAIILYFSFSLHNALLIWWILFAQRQHTWSFCGRLPAYTVPLLLESSTPFSRVQSFPHILFIFFIPRFVSSDSSSRCSLFKTSCPDNILSIKIRTFHFSNSFLFSLLSLLKRSSESQECLAITHLNLKLHNAKIVYRRSCQDYVNAKILVLSSFMAFPVGQVIKEQVDPCVGSKHGSTPKLWNLTLNVSFQADSYALPQKRSVIIDS